MDNAKEILKNIIKLASEEAQKLEDEEALKVSFLYPDYKINQDYKVGDKFLYNDVLYKVLQPHLSKENWPPDQAHSLYTKVLIPDTNNLYEWEQPDPTNPYMKGDRVLFQDNTYESTIDNNTWSPADHPDGWKLIKGGD